MVRSSDLIAAVGLQGASTMLGIAIPTVSLGFNLLGDGRATSPPRCSNDHTRLA
jgi:hypothetical protein